MCHFDIPSYLAKQKQTLQKKLQNKHKLNRSIYVLVLFFLLMLYCVEVLLEMNQIYHST